MSNDTARGLLAMLASVAAFAVMDAAMKQLAQTYPPMEVSCLRGLASIPVFLLAIAGTGQWRSVVPVRWGAHLVRGGLSILMLWMFIYSMSRLPLSTVYGIVLCAPLLITGLSALVLREHVGRHRWIAVVFGLVGVAIILNASGTGVATLAGFAALGAALCYAVVALMLRGLNRFHFEHRTLVRRHHRSGLRHSGLPGLGGAGARGLAVDCRRRFERLAGSISHSQRVPMCAAFGRRTLRVHGIAMGNRPGLDSLGNGSERARPRRRERCDCDRTVPDPPRALCVTQHLEADT